MPTPPLGLCAFVCRQPKNFKGSSTKKGSFGMAGTTIAPIPEYAPCEGCTHPFLWPCSEPLACQLRLPTSCTLLAEYSDPTPISAENAVCGCCRYVPDPYDGPRLERQRRAIAELEASKDKPKYITTCQAAGRTTLDVPEHARTSAGKVRADLRVVCV